MAVYEDDAGGAGGGDAAKPAADASSTHGPPFPAGTVVRRRAAPDQVGLVREVVRHEQIDERLYRVQFGTQTKTVPQQDLETLPEDTDPWSELLNARFEGHTAYRRLLTFERLRRPPSRVATTFGTARAKLFPYQFKPLLKFLDNPSQRILIADDVGLGKTIEAGYILKELKARHELERVLIVVPARLRAKWKTELAWRFDESFDVVSAQEFRHGFIEPLRRGRDLPTFAWIASYESLRRKDIIASLTELQPPIDMVIMDEAHKVRHTDTQQHALAEALRHADAMVLLTATPIQTSQENLFRLLQLLDPVTFERYDVFEAQLQANRAVVQALAAIRENPPRVGVAREALNGLRAQRLTAELTEGDFFASILQRLDPGTLEDRAVLVELQRDVSELSLTSQVLTRTRKVEVMPDRPVRRATACRVELTAEELRVYKAIGMIALYVNPTQMGAVLAAMTAVRFAASCLPAAVDHFRKRFGAKLDALCRDVGDTEDSGEESEVAPEVQLVDFWPQLRNDLATDLSVDSKFDRLVAALEELWCNDRMAQRPTRKVIVFSFFRGTLAYLDSRLRAADLDTRMIHGLVPLPARAQLIDEFLTNPKVRVLLASEVGSEGIDLQQASVVINYDLPWNPMVVEQRIGRIDRLGQESQTLTILSLVLCDTIEDQILYRLYERIGIFEETIGEIEPILGETIEKLAMAALRGELTREEQERRAEEAANAFLLERSQGKTLQRRADQLIAGDQAFLDEVESLIGDRKVPAPSELFRFLDEFLARRYPGCALPNAALDTTAEVRLDRQFATDLLRELGNTTEVRRTAARVQQGAFPMTFNADANLRRPYSELVSIHHPFVRLVRAMYERDAEGLHRAFHLRLFAEGDEERYDYLLAVLEFSISGTRPRTEMVPILWDLRRNGPVAADVSRRVFLRLLEDAEGAEGVPAVSEELIERGIEGMRAHLGDVRAGMRSRETRLQAARGARRRITQEATLRAKVRAAETRLGMLRSRGAAAFAVRMAVAKLDREQNRLDAFLESADEASVSVEEREVAVAVVSVSDRARRRSEGA